MSPPTIDIHINLAGVGTNNSGCWTSREFRSRYTFRLLKWLNGITREQMRTSIDKDWARKLSLLIKGSHLDYGVVLGFDGVYDTVTGEPLPKSSQMIVPPEWVFKVCHNLPELLPGPSVNPYRRDALDVLDYCFEKGAVLIKWIPPVQNIDATDKIIRPFLEKLAALKLPLLVHTGGERTFRPIDKSLGRIGRLRTALDIGVKVIAAHAATNIVLSGEDDETPLLLQMLQRYPNLWVDNSGLCNPGRFPGLPHIAQYPEIVARTLYGSDYPIPANAVYYVRELGFKKVRELERIKNVVDRDVAIKQAFGFPDSTLTAANGVLANLEKWL